MQDYRKLRVWQKAHRLALEMYAAAAYAAESPSLASSDQIARAAISVPSNIAEGAGRGTDRDFRRFLVHSLGSLNELEYDLLLARDLGFLPDSDPRPGLGLGRGSQTNAQRTDRQPES